MAAGAEGRDSRGKRERGSRICTSRKEVATQCRMQDKCCADYGYVRAKKIRGSGVQIKRNKFGCEIEY